MSRNFDAIIDELLTDEVAVVPLNVAYALCAITDGGVGRIVAIKRRPAEKTCSVLGTPRIFRALIDSPVGARVDELTLPVGLIAPLSPTAPTLPAGVGMNGTVNVFLASGAFGTGLADAAFNRGLLVVGSSANLSGTGNNYCLADVESEIASVAAIVVDDGPARFQEYTRTGEPVASTNIDISNPMAARALRRGLVFDGVCAQLIGIGIRFDE